MMMKILLIFKPVINIFLPCPCTSETINVYLLLQEELKKARARVEDLEEQIRMKDKLEK